MVRAICPDCSERGSITYTEINGTKYWKTFHSQERQCYLGTGPFDAEVIKDRKEPVRTETMTFNQDTEPSDLS